MNDEDELRDIFSLIDADQSGAISAQELQQFASSLPRQLPPSEVEGLLQEFDDDGNGQIDEGEFLGVVKRLEEVSGTRIEQMVALFKKDCFRKLFKAVSSDGMVTKNKMRSVVDSMHSGQQRLEFPRLFSEYDSEYQNAVDEAGFVAIIERLSDGKPISQIMHREEQRKKRFQSFRFAFGGDDGGAERPESLQRRQIKKVESSLSVSKRESVVDDELAEKERRAAQAEADRLTREREAEEERLRAQAREEARLAEEARAEAARKEREAEELRRKQNEREAEAARLRLEEERERERERIEEADRLRAEAEAKEREAEQLRLEKERKEAEAQKMRDEARRREEEAARLRELARQAVREGKAKEEEWRKKLEEMEKAAAEERRSLRARLRRELQRRQKDQEELRALKLELEAIHRDGCPRCRDLPPPRARSGVRLALVSASLAIVAAASADTYRRRRPAGVRAACVAGTVAVLTISRTLAIVAHSPRLTPPWPAHWTPQDSLPLDHVRTLSRLCAERSKGTLSPGSFEAAKRQLMSGF
eukprot:Hpha_TRINITY_DN19332_c0_g1::TRINITY_DN19332_c0_g1_i1::g.81300::m.81300